MTGNCQEEKRREKKWMDICSHMLIRLWCHSEMKKVMYSLVSINGFGVLGRKLCTVKISVWHIQKHIKLLFQKSQKQSEGQSYNVNNSVTVCLSQRCVCVYQIYSGRHSWSLSAWRTWSLAWLRLTERSAPRNRVWHAAKTSWPTHRPASHRRLNG